MGRRRGQSGRRWPFLVGVVLAAVCPAVADTVDGVEAATGRATTFLELAVDDSEVRGLLETGVPDLIAFEGVLPDDFRVRMGLLPEPEAERLDRFFAEELVLRRADGSRLAGRRVSFTTSWRWPRDPLTGERRPAADGGGMPVVRVGLAWDLDGPPANLRLEPAMVGRTERGATVALVVEHRGAPVAGAAVLDGPVELELDWKRPWRSQFAGSGPAPRLREPLRVALEIGADEVRVEVWARAADLARWLDLGPGAGSGPGGRAAFAHRAAELVAERLELAVDGERTLPVLERAEPVRRRALGSFEVGIPEDEGGDAFVRSVLVHRTAAAPERAELRWHLFPDDAEGVEGAVVDAGGPAAVRLTPGSRVMSWAAPGGRAAPRPVEAPPPPVLRPAVWLLRAGALAVAIVLVSCVARAAGGSAPWAKAAAAAVLAAVLAAAAWAAASAVEVDDRRAAAIVEPILHDLFLAGELDDADRRAAAVGPWVAEGLEAAVAEAVRRPFELAGRGRDLTVARGVELVAAEASRHGDGFVARCRWRVLVGVVHWGHLHVRVGSGAGELVVEPVDGVWTVTGWPPEVTTAG